MSEELDQPKVLTPEPQNKTGADAERIENEQAFLRKFNLYKELGTPTEIKEQLALANRFKALESAIKQEGADLSQLPQMLEQLNRQQEISERAKQEFEAQIQLKEAEYQKRIAEIQTQATQAKEALLNTQRANSVLPHFNANARPEALPEWNRYWQDLSKYIEFEPDGTTVKRVLAPDGSALWDTSGKEAREATITDLFDQIIDGKYGFFLQSAMRPASSAMGGGAINPASGEPGTVRLNADGPQDPTFYANLTKEQRDAIRRGLVRRQ